MVYKVQTSRYGMALLMIQGNIDSHARQLIKQNIDALIDQLDKEGRVKDI